MIRSACSAVSYNYEATSRDATIMNEPGKYWVQVSGNIIVARIRGNLTQDLLFALSGEIASKVQKSGLKRILVDALEMNPPEVELPMLQWKLNEEQRKLQLRRAILVADSRMAFLAGIAFGDEAHRIFYNDLAAATKWLSE